MSGDDDFISVSEAARSWKWLKPLSTATVERMCRERILIAVKLGNNRKGRGHWLISRRSIMVHKLQANSQHL